MIDQRLHIDLFPRSWPTVPEHAAIMFGNYSLAYDTDVDELPDTPVQRWLESSVACVRGRAEVGEMSVSLLRRRLPFHSKWERWLLEEYDMAHPDERSIASITDPDERRIVALANAVEWAVRQIAEQVGQ